MMSPLRLLRDFSAGFMLAGLSWACWAWRTAACVAGRSMICGLFAGCEEAITLGAVLWVVGFKTKAGAVGCCCGAAVGAAVATAWR